MKKLSSLIAVAVLGSGLSMAANASYTAPAPYGTPGTYNNTTYTFTATATGHVQAYWADYNTAGYTNLLGLMVNGVDTGIYGLNNQTSAIGDMLDFGTVNAGDTLVFTLHVQTTGDVWYSNPTMNADGLNHVYSSAFSGSGLVPAGTYVSFEDLRNGGDLNYHDENFVFTNVSTVSNVPVPAAAWLLGSGLIGLAGVARRKAA